MHSAPASIPVNRPVIDAATLAPHRVLTVDDDLTAAIALPNEQVLLVGATLHLFTPPPPAL